MTNHSPLDLVARRHLYESGQTVAGLAKAMGVSELTANQKLLRNNLDMREIKILGQLVGVPASQIFAETES